MKQAVLIVSKTFIGGGLETRINSIVDKYSNQYTFFLLTKTNRDIMNVQPSKNFKKIYNWDERLIALNNAQIVSLHPFDILQDFKEILQVSNKKIFYTLHGEYSLLEDFSVLGQKVDLFYSVSVKLIELFKNKYPQFKSKIKLFKNYYPFEIQSMERNIITEKNILFSITNFSYWNYYNNLVNFIPEEYAIHFIGYNDVEKYNRRNIVYDGFVNIQKYLKENKFFIGFSRGGYSAMDLIAHNIPTVLIYNRENSLYRELLTRDNFEKLSNQNFVTFNQSKDFDISNMLDLIKTNREKFICNDLLQKYNGINYMPNPYILDFI